MSMSNRARRMAQHHLRHRADAQLNLIPLIDILSVMVAFLLVYSTEVEVIQNAKGIEIPQSIAQTAPKQSVVVMITKTDLFVQGEFIATVADIHAAPGTLVEPLRVALKRPLLVGQRGERARHRAARDHHHGGQGACPTTCSSASWPPARMPTTAAFRWRSSRRKSRSPPASSSRVNAAWCIAPYYREYELPWEGDPEASARFRKILRVLLIIFVVFGILFPLLPAPEARRRPTEVPQRLARVMLENTPKPPPPPPPAPKEEKPKIEPKIAGEAAAGR